MAPTVVGFMPSLFHIATVKVALPLFRGFDIETLCLAFREIQYENSTSSNDGSRKNHGASYERAKKHLLLIPGHLRIKILQAVKGFHYAAEIWREDHLKILKLKDLKCILHWKSNGSIDTVKTAEHLVQNEKIRTRKRFQIACKYCLEKSVKTLWKEMEASGKTENFETVDIMVNL
ncbi:hypothetical protein AVEN_104869-1 [Araneus ventricosus]|uniref:Uncharacterized protein n=1 Tax=Araneus ventricosus TaxID=182803 RepID=A0A4Y2IQ36_ARAVE|nr:hypothetical protein AVEN_104869-1 [Araneus ventricosus]